MNYIYAAPRRGGKTSWMLNQVIKDLYSGKKVAIVVPTAVRRDHLSRHERFDFIADVDVYSERSFENARGRQFDVIYIDDANDFHDDLTEFCAHWFPGTEVNLTYTPYPFESSLPVDFPIRPQSKFDMDWFIGAWLRSQVDNG